MTTPHDHRIRLADICLTVMVILLIATAAAGYATAYADHAAWCKLPVHSIPCGETK